MADTKRNIWNDDDGEESSRGSGKLRTFLIFFLTLVVVLGVVVFAAYRDGTGLDVLRRYLNYGGAEQAGGETVYEYDASGTNHYAALENTLVLLSDTGLHVLDDRGGEVWSESVNMKNPALVHGGGRAVAYDVGGTVLYVVNAEGLVKKFTTDEETPFIAASLNQNGWLAVTAEKKNYKGCVSVYDDELELVFAFNSSRRFVMDAYVTDENTHLAAVTLGQEDSVFISNIVIYDLTKTEPDADYNVSDGLVAAIGQQEDRLITVSDTCLTIAGIDGTVAANYLYEDEYIRDYDLGGEDFAVLLLNRYQSGSVGRLVSIGTDGMELGSLDVNEEVRDISVVGRYLAVLYADRLVVYNRDLQIYASLRGTETTRGVVMRPDGSAILLAAERGSLFLP